jgi:hypothetical protein
MRAMLPQVTSVGDDPRHNPEGSYDSIYDRQTKVGESDPLPRVVLLIRQIAAASISKNGQLGLLALWQKATPCPHRGFARMRARFHPSAFRNIY